MGEAERELGHCESGTGGWGGTCGPEPNRVAAAQWYARAAEHKDLEGIKALAFVYGRGLNRQPYILNVTKSRELYTQCAELGGYPDGMPCEVERWAMEVLWLVLAGWEWVISLFYLRSAA